MSSRSPGAPQATPPGRCDHDNVELLGSEGNAMYYRCTACGDSLVEQGGRRWVVPAVPKTTRP